MADKGGAPEWRVIGESVPGATHLRAGIPNQDAILQMRESGRGLPLVVSLSDGHGSDKCFRSHKGSRFAVRKGAQLVGEFLDDWRGRFDRVSMESELKNKVSRELVRRWREAVEQDLKSEPFSGAELETLEKKDGAGARKMVEDNPLLAYGATSLTVAVEETFILFLQLGDGEILTVAETGEVAKALPPDERLFANETTSLCLAGAENDFRCGVRQINDSRPALILVSTDGYVNSFADDAGFLKVGTDLLEMMRAEGFDSINASLKGWLEEATRAGSGDDTTVCIICRMDALAKAETEAATQAGTAQGENAEPAAAAQAAQPGAQAPQASTEEAEAAEGGGPGA
ncbi:MAG TPA: PP2C family serine/threonine-protein phosphatase [Pyrinomonadaceae bacterium]|nr:PP2C family serine/threonine-protein phosphatase [Pyrinomonadaceae bacterium]